MGGMVITDHTRHINTNEEEEMAKLLGLEVNLATKPSGRKRPVKVIQQKDKTLVIA